MSARHRFDPVNVAVWTLVAAIGCTVAYSLAQVLRAVVTLLRVTQ